MFWPSLPGSRYAGECWAIEAELTPKPIARTTTIMAGLLAQAGDDDQFRYDRVVYLTAPAARSVVERAAAQVADGSRVVVRDLPPTAVVVG